jgi:RNA-binding protein YlmH
MAAHVIGADEEERQALFGEACEAIERKLHEQAQAIKATALVGEVASEGDKFSRDMVQQALWSLVEAGRVKVNGKSEASLIEPLGIA